VPLRLGTRRTVMLGFRSQKIGLGSRRNWKQLSSSSQDDQHNTTKISFAR
jgi:hypothetical protein